MTPGANAPGVLSYESDLFFLKILLQELQHRGSQQEHGYQVGHDHKAVEGVGHVPDKPQIHRCAHDGNQGVGDVEGQNDLASEEEFGAPGTVEPPADDGGEGEAAHGDGGENGHPAAVDGHKAGDGQLRAGGLAVGHGHAAEQNDKSGHGADDDGVHEHLEDAEHALFHGLAGVGAGVGDGAGAKTCLIGENAPGNALLHAQKEAAHNAAGDGGGLEGTFENGGEDRGNGLNSGNDDAQSQNDVQQSHQGHQLLADLADALDAADENQAYHQADDDADDKTAGGNLGGGEQVEVQQRRVDGGGDGVDLGGVAGAENGHHAEDGIQRGKPAPSAAQAIFNVVHRTTSVSTLFINFSVFNG